MGFVQTMKTDTVKSNQEECFSYMLFFDLELQDLEMFYA
jgi:hypothetical protein